MRSSNNKKGRVVHAIFDSDVGRACPKLDQCPVRAPNNRQRGCDVRNTNGNYRLKVTAQLELRDQMYQSSKPTNGSNRKRYERASKPPSRNLNVVTVWTNYECEEHLKCALPSYAK
jgi:hypothetical protein